MKRPPRICLTAFVTASLLALGAGAAHADTTVQVPMGTLLDKRSVTVLQGTTLVVFTLAIDGGGTDTGDGAQNGFATQAVCTLKGQPITSCLPDDGHFPANMRHPDVVLNISNAAPATSGQAHMVAPTGGTFSFPMPPATYSKVFLFFHGANNGVMITMTLTYSDGTTQVVNDMIPDFFSDPTDPMVFSLAGNLAKWTKTTTIAEANHHNIDGVEVDPTAGKTLTMIQVARTMPGYLVFYGATGIATSAVAGLPDGGAGASGGDASTDAGAGGASATGGISGAGGADTSGAGGSTGAGGAGGQTAGTAGSTAAAGTSGTGSGGAAGATTTGAAGSTGGVNECSCPPGGSGCSCRLDATGREVSSARALLLVLGAASLTCLGRRRRRARPRGR